jgi:hypothetical protein
LDEIAVCADKKAACTDADELPICKQSPEDLTGLAAFHP